MRMGTTCHLRCLGLISLAVNLLGLAEPFCVYRAIGLAEVLMAKADELGQLRMKGVAGEVARKILHERPT